MFFFCDKRYGTLQNWVTTGSAAKCFRDKNTCWMMFVYFRFILNLVGKVTKLAASFIEAAFRLCCLLSRYRYESSMIACAIGWKSPSHVSSFLGAFCSFLNFTFLLLNCFVVLCESFLVSFICVSILVM